MVINELSSKTVFLDTAPLIYFIEGSSQYQPLLSRLFEMNDKGVFSFITSSITLLEVLVKPLRQGRSDLAQQYKEILVNAGGIEIFDVTSAIAEIAAGLRAQYNLRTPDSIQIATSIHGGADHFLTNDSALKRVSAAKVITLDEII